MSELSHTVESALRHSIERCPTLAFLAGTRESVPPDGVWSGLEGLFTELTETLDAIQEKLKPRNIVSSNLNSADCQRSSSACALRRAVAASVRGISRQNSSPP